jgi:hypothetical protein
VVSYVPSTHMEVHAMGFIDASGQNVSVGQGKQPALPLPCL